MAIPVVILALLVINLTDLAAAKNLKLVTVLFRHGDRTPDSSSLYPLDPYFNEAFYPIGIGQLTNNGKRRLFEFGQLLNKRYGHFLGESYYPGLLEAISTDVDRTKASLQLVLAGLFPPTGKDLKWNSHLNWQPIPVNYTSNERDMWLQMDLKKRCPKYTKVLKEYVESAALDDFRNRNSELFQFLSVRTGFNFTDITRVWALYSTLLSEEEWGLTLPQWTKRVYPDILERLTVEVVHTYIATLELKQLSGGILIKRIVDNLFAKIEDRPGQIDKKLILYSAHDINVAYLSAIFGQIIERPIPYGSYYIIELVESNGVYNVQIYANDYVSQNITEVNLPGCGKVCPLKDFTNLVEKYFTDDSACWNV